MLNTNHWSNILQPGSSQVLLASSCPSIKVYFSPDFSHKKSRPPKPVKVKVRKITIIRQLIDHLEGVYPRWVTVNDLLTLPFLEGKSKPNILAVLQNIDSKSPVEARVVPPQACHRGRPSKEYRLKKQDGTQVYLSGRATKSAVIKPPKKMFTSAKIAQYLTEIYPCWVTTDHLLTLPFLEGKKRQTLLHMLTYMRVEAKKPLEVRLVSVMQPGGHRPYKEYRLKKQPDA